MKNQDQAHKVQAEMLPIGSGVYVKTVGLNHKLFDKYKVLLRFVRTVKKETTSLKMC